MTTVNEAAKTGIGRILANFPEIPALARSIVEETIDRLKAAGINGVFTPGNMREPVYRIAVGMNRVGMVSSNGLNPVAAAVEAGIEVDTVSESGMIAFSSSPVFGNTGLNCLTKQNRHSLFVRSDAYTFC